MRSTRVYLFVIWDWSDALFFPLASIAKIALSDVQLEVIESDDALYALSLQREERGTEAPSQAEQMKRETLDRLAGLKETIDRKTQRYKSKTGLGLDVIYVEDRLLSMGFPSSFQIKKLASFLLSTHKEYRVYNFCEEENYEQKKFSEGTHHCIVCLVWSDGMQWFRIHSPSIVHRPLSSSTPSSPTWYLLTTLLPFAPFLPFLEPCAPHYPSHFTLNKLAARSLRGQGRSGGGSTLQDSARPQWVDDGVLAHRLGQVPLCEPRHPVHQRQTRRRDQLHPQSIALRMLPISVLRISVDVSVNEIDLLY